MEVRVHWGDELLEVEHVSAEHAENLERREGLRYEIRPVVVAAAFGPAQMDRAPWIYVGATLAFAGLILLAAAFLPPSRAMLTMEQNQLPSRTVRSLLMEEVPPEPEREPTPAAFEGETSVVAPGALGRAGAPDAPAQRRRSEASGPREPDDDHGRRSVEVGALAALRSMQGSWDSSSPFAGLGGGAHALASLTGDRVGESFGFGALSLSSIGRGAGIEGGTEVLDGLGLRGAGAGGTCGCDAGGFGAIGHGGGTGTGLARVEPELRDRESRVPQRIVRCGCAHLRIAGMLSRDVIRRVVRRHHDEVRHCYERGLQARPDLAGRVLTRFTIAPTGVVVASSIESSSVAHARTEMCIAAAVRRWAFPSSDGVTSVTYPFVLEST